MNISQRLANRALVTVLATAFASALIAGTAGPVHAAQVNYLPSEASFANPERGLFRQPNCDTTALDVAWMTEWRTTQHVSLVRCFFSLREFKETPISRDKLAWIQQQTDRVEAAGLKMIVRFAYTESEVGDDAPVARVLAHIDQLTPYFRSNSDVIDIVESGFVGAWGEGYYTQNFGNKGVLTVQDWENRKAVVTKLLSAVPSTRMVQLRTPVMKRTMYGSAAISSANAYNGSALARLGHHNDCFLADEKDQGTYSDTAVEYPYLRSDTTYGAMGGETCALNPPRSDCATARQELAMFHYSYLNQDYDPTVMQSWSAGGCLTEVQRRLGYRFELLASLFPASVARGGTYLAQVFVKNTGYATPHNARPVYLVMRNTATGVTSRVELSTDPRRWAPGTTSSIIQNVGVPASMKPGTYELLLSLPDPAPALTAKPHYAIRMANEGGVWEAATGFNKLLAQIDVTGVQAGPSLPATPTGLSGSTTNSSVTLTWNGVDTATSYDVFRSGTRVGSSTTPSFTETGLQPETAYSYAVTAVNKAGSSSPSNPATLTTLGGQPHLPDIPAGLRVTAATSTTVSVAWNVVAAATDYVVTRDGTQLPSVTGTTLTDGGLTPSTTYTYAIAARNAVGSSQESSSVTVKTTAALVTAFSVSGDVWRANDTGANLGTAWRTAGYDDASWKSGRSQLGYGDGDEATVLTGGSNPNGKQITNYFRRTFDAGTSVTPITQLTLRAVVDDGAVVYLNGTEIWRFNLPAGAVTSTTRASRYIAGAEENLWWTVTLPTTALVAGLNTLAAEVHNDLPSSSDITFDLELRPVR